MCVGECKNIDYDIYPYNATNQAVIWLSTDNSVAEIDLHTGRITAKAPGVTTIRATTVDGGFTDNCLLTVIYDTVTITKDGDFNKVVFHSSGKEWRCINQDMIYVQDNEFDSVLNPRFQYNFFRKINESGTLVLDNRTRYYTDAEIKLLYAIDPHGVAKYVQRFAETLDGRTAGKEYKDSIFRLLFNRNPRYFARTEEGVWFETTNNSNLLAVQSESECIFGMQILWDDYAMQELRELSYSIFSLAFDLLVYIPWVNTIVDTNNVIDIMYKLVGYCISAGTDGIGSATLSELTEEAFENTSFKWLYNAVSVYTSIYDIVSDFDTGENYYPQLLDYCVNDLPFHIYVELKNGQKWKLDDIKELMSSN